MLVVDKEMDVGGGDACDGLDGVHRRVDGGGDGVWAKAKASVDD